MKFITILAIIFLVLFLLRILGVLFGKRSERTKMIINYLNSNGHNIYYDHLKFPVIGSLVCIAWLVSLYF